MDLPQPFFPLCPEKLLTTVQVNAGQVLKQALGNHVSAKYSSACDKLDELRENIRQIQDITLMNAKNIVQYSNLLTNLMTDDALDRYNISYTYDGVSKNSIEFEMFCLYYNTGLTLIKSIYVYKANSANVDKYIWVIKLANDLVSKARDYHSKEFEHVVPSGSIDRVLDFIKGCYAAAQAGAALSKNAPLNLLSKIAMRASNIFNGIYMLPQYHRQYYKALSLAYLAAHVHKQYEYGECIQLIKRSFNIVYAENKKKKDPFYQSWNELYTELVPLYDYYITDCDKMSAIEKRREIEVPALSNDMKILSAIENWDELPPEFTKSDLINPVVSNVF